MCASMCASLCARHCAFIRFVRQVVRVVVRRAQRGTETAIYSLGFLTGRRRIVSPPFRTAGAQLWQRTTSRFRPPSSPRLRTTERRKWPRYASHSLPCSTVLLLCTRFSQICAQLHLQSVAHNFVFCHVLLRTALSELTVLLHLVR